jgi:membrane-associated phospholipid phosphatase
MLSRVGKRLPHGWGDLFLQLGIWFGFIAAYQIARGVADRSPAEAFANGHLVIDFEQKLHLLIEEDLQRVVMHTGGILLHAVDWTYWMSQFTVLGLGLLWIYFCRNEAFTHVRNWVLLSNVLGLVGYVLMPTAPPRMFPELGFVDTLAQSSALNHGSGLVELASNPYAAMPSLHAADALIIGFAMTSLVRSRWAKLLWTLWPSWVWFSVMATGNHFWLDIAAGIGLAVLAGAVLAFIESRRSETSPAYLVERRG